MFSAYSGDIARTPVRHREKIGFFREDDELSSITFDSVASERFIAEKVASLLENLSNRVAT